MLALSGVSSVLLVTWLGAADVADIVALRIAAYACWLIGGIGLWTLLSSEAIAEENQKLAELRGVKMEDPEFVALSVVRLLSKGMFWASLPGLLVAALVSTSSSMFAQRVALLVCTMAYLLSLAVVLALIGALSSRLSRTRARIIAAALVLGPFLLSITASSPLSIPSFYIWTFGKLIAWGGIA